MFDLSQNGEQRLSQSSRDRDSQSAKKIRNMYDSAKNYDELRDKFGE